MNTPKEQFLEDKVAQWERWYYAMREERDRLLAIAEAAKELRSAYSEAASHNESTPYETVRAGVSRRIELTKALDAALAALEAKP